MWRGLPLSILVFLGLSVFDLGPMYATDVRQTDRRQKASSLNVPALGAGHNKQVRHSISPAPRSFPLGLHALHLRLLDRACIQAGPTSSLERRVAQHTLIIIQTFVRRTLSASELNLYIRTGMQWRFYVEGGEAAKSRFRVREWASILTAHEHVIGHSDVINN